MLAGVASKASACGRRRLRLEALAAAAATSTSLGRRRAQRLLGGQVDAERAVRWQQAAARHALHVGQRRRRARGRASGRTAASRPAPPPRTAPRPTVSGLVKRLLPAVQPLAFARAAAPRSVTGSRASDSSSVASSRLRAALRVLPRRELRRRTSCNARLGQRPATRHRSPAASCFSISRLCSAARRRVAARSAPAARPPR